MAPPLMTIFGAVAFLFGLILMSMTANYFDEGVDPPYFEVDPDWKGGGLGSILGGLGNIGNNGNGNRRLLEANPFALDGHPRRLLATPAPQRACTGGTSSGCSTQGKKDVNSWRMKRKAVPSVIGTFNSWALLAGTCFCLTGIVAVMAGMGKGSGEVAITMFWICLALNFIAFGLACKHINMSNCKQTDIQNDEVPHCGCMTDNDGAEWCGIGSLVHAIEAFAIINWFFNVVFVVLLVVKGGKASAVGVMPS